MISGVFYKVRYFDPYTINLYEKWVLIVIIFTDIDRFCSTRMHGLRVGCKSDTRQKGDTIPPDKIPVIRAGVCMLFFAVVLWLSAILLNIAITGQVFTRMDFFTLSSCPLIRVSPSHRILPDNFYCFYQRCCCLPVQACFKDFSCYW